MTTGIRIWGSTGNLELDENSFTVRVIYSALVTREVERPNVTRSVLISIPEVNPDNYTAVCVPNLSFTGDPSGQDARNSQFDAQVVQGGVVVWFANRVMPTSTAFGVGTQRLLVMRYR